MIDICYCVNDDDDDASDCTFVLWKIIIFIRRKPIQGTGFVFDSDDDDNRDDEDNDDDDSSDDNVHLLNICQNPQRVDLSDMIFVKSFTHAYILTPGNLPEENA